MATTLTVTNLMKTYGQPKQAKPKTTDAEKGRITVGKVFCQPTKQGTNFKTCYWGFLGRDNTFTAGFCMANSKVLEMVEAGHLPKDCLETFKAYAEVNLPKGNIVL